MLEKVKKSGKSFLSPSDEDSIVSIFDIGQRIKMSGLCLLEKLPCLLNSCYARFHIILGQQWARQTSSTANICNRQAKNKSEPRPHSPHLIPKGKKDEKSAMGQWALSEHFTSTTGKPMRMPFNNSPSVPFTTAGMYSLGTAPPTTEF